MMDNPNPITQAALPAKPYTEQRIDQRTEPRADRRIVFLAIEFLIGAALALLLTAYQLDGHPGMNMMSVLLGAVCCTAAGHPHVRSELHALFTNGNFVFYQIPAAAALAALQLYCAGCMGGITGMIAWGFMMIPLAGFTLWVTRKERQPSCF